MIKNSQKGGALLINVMVSVSILTMLTLISIPYLRKYQTNFILSSTAKDLASDLRYAQQLTVTEQTAYAVTFDSSAKSYIIEKTGAASTTIKSVNFPADISYQHIDTNLNNQVLFNSFGAVSNSGDIILQNTNNKTATIDIKPSGYIELTQ